VDDQVWLQQHQIEEQIPCSLLLGPALLAQVCPELAILLALLFPGMMIPILIMYMLKMAVIFEALNSNC
jgi:hypothetical protein